MGTEVIGDPLENSRATVFQYNVFIKAALPSA